MFNERPFFLIKSIKMEHSMYISFQLKRSKINKNGQAPINMRITVDGKRVELSTHRRISPSRWDNDLGQAVGESDEARILNNYLDSLKTKVQRQFNILESLDEEITAETIKNKLSGKSVQKKTLVNIYRYYNDDMKAKE